LAWEIKFSETARKQLAKIDRQAQKDIGKYLKERIAPSEEPRSYGDPLRKNLSGLWKYRVGSYRVIVNIQDDELIVLVVRVGHRKNVYGQH